MIVLILRVEVAQICWLIIGYNDTTCNLAKPTSSLDKKQAFLQTSSVCLLGPIWLS